MQIEEITKSIEIVNGEKLYLLDIEKLDNIKKEDSINGICIGPGSMDYFFLWIKFVKKYDNFCLALNFHKMGEMRLLWLYYLLYKYNGVWQKVEIETSDCTYCTWRGRIANPTAPDLYSNITKGWQTALNAAWNLPEVSCPRCGHKLKRKAIWAEKESNSQSDVL